MIKERQEVQRDENRAEVTKSKVRDQDKRVEEEREESRDGPGPMCLSKVEKEIKKRRKHRVKAARLQCGCSLLGRFGFRQIGILEQPWNSIGKMGAGGKSRCNGGAQKSMTNDKATVQ